MSGVKIGMEIKGVEALAKKLQPDAVKTPLAEAITNITLWLAHTVKTATPVGTPESTGKKGYDGGRLRASITQKVTGEVGRVGTMTEYASFVEEGTKRNMRARHVQPGTQTRIYGKGMFAYGLEKLQEKLPEFLRGIGRAIQARFE